MASFLMQFYEGVPPPKTILVDREPEECALLAEALGESANRKVEISVPQRGNRRRLLEQAVRNAGEELDRRLAESSSQAKLGREQDGRGVCRERGCESGEIAGGGATVKKKTK